jgi:hypothetical protein
MDTTKKEKYGIAESLVWRGGWLGTVLILPQAKSLVFYSIT